MQPVIHSLDTPFSIGPVYCYSIESEDGLILVDCGLATEEAKRYYRQSFDLSRLRHILVTHSHSDHCGLAAWLAAQSGAKVYFPYRDYLKASHVNDYLRLLGDLMHGMGFDNHYYERLMAVLNAERFLAPIPQDILVAEQDFPKNLGVDFIACPSHSQSDLVYLTDGCAITGDTLLRGLFQTPTLEVDMEQGGRFNNYEAYCDSMIKLAALEGRRILPGHFQAPPTIREAQLFYVKKLLRRAERLRPWRHEANISDIISEMFAGGMKDTITVFLKAAELLFMQDFFREPERLAVSLQHVGLYDQVEGRYNRALGRGKKATARQALG